jgi:hypothetical protein
MRRLLRYRSQARWLVLLAGLASVAVAIAGLVPHGDDDRHCLVCKVGQQPLEELGATVVLSAPPQPILRARNDGACELRSFVAESASPRGPPA